MAWPSAGLEVRLFKKWWLAFRAGNRGEPFGLARSRSREERQTPISRWRIGTHCKLLSSGMLGGVDGCYFSEGKPSRPHGGRRSGNSAAVCTQRRAAIARTQVRLLPGTVRSLHGPHTRAGGALLRDASQRCKTAGGHDAGGLGNAGKNARDSAGVY